MESCYFRYVSVFFLSVPNWTLDLDFNYIVPLHIFSWGKTHTHTHAHVYKLHFSQLNAFYVVWLYVRKKQVLQNVYGRHMLRIRNVLNSWVSQMATIQRICVFFTLFKKDMTRSIKIVALTPATSVSVVPC